ncbi:LuxR C-terminal-related transcriptional regulator [Microbacterium sp. F2]|uniref:LuxR C-terminal-related transcriptional regulator n=1 Tax=Microbacterium sp. F2 TaxID=3422228 RepID=UPI003FD4F555
MVLPARVAVVDDHELVALALQSVLTDVDDLDFDRHARTVAALTTRPREADVVVLDLSLRDGSDPAANVAALRQWGARVLVLTSAEDPYLVREASRTEALGILRKTAPRTALVDALRSVAAGDHVPSTEWASAIDSDPLVHAAPLTPREREVLALYASGMGAREVATALFVSENTVNDHLRRIRAVYHHLGRPAATKVELYRRGLEDGFFPAPRRE